MARYDYHRDSQGRYVLKGDIVKYLGDGYMAAKKGALALVEACDPDQAYIKLKWFGPGQNRQIDGMYHSEHFEILTFQDFQKMPPYVGIDVINAVATDSMFGKVGTITVRSDAGFVLVFYPHANMTRQYPLTSWGLSLVPIHFHYELANGTFGHEVAVTDADAVDTDATEADADEASDSSDDTLTKLRDEVAAMGESTDELAEATSDTAKAVLKVEARQALISAALDKVATLLDILGEHAKASDDTFDTMTDEVKDFGVQLGTQRRVLNEFSEDLNSVRRVLTNLSAEVSANKSEMESTKRDLGRISDAAQACLRELTDHKEFMEGLAGRITQIEASRR